MNIAELLPTLLLLLCLIFLSAFFSASETAISSIHKNKIKQLHRSKQKKDKRLAKLLNEKSRVIVSLLVGNNIVNIWSSSIATAFAIHLFGEQGVFYATVTMTLIILIFAEITPKIIASSHPEPIAKGITPILCVLRIILFVPVQIFTKINLIFVNFLRHMAPEDIHKLTEEELRTIMDFGKQDGSLEETEHGLLHRAFKFNDTKIKEIMTPRTSITALSADAKPAFIRSVFRDSHFSRLPIYNKDMDHIEGIVHYKDVLFLLPDVADSPALAFSRPVIFVPETQSTTQLLQEFKRNKQHLAIVLDERGTTVGLVTIDDALESLFGGISSASQDKTSSNSIQVLSPNHIKVPGHIKLDDLNALLRTDFDSDYYETLAGLILEKEGKLPTKGITHTIKNMKITVEEVVNRQITRLDIRLQE